MALQIDTGSVTAKKTLSYTPRPAKNRKSGKMSPVTSAVSSNGSVIAKRAEINGNAKILRHNLSTAWKRFNTTPQLGADDIVARNGGRGRLNTEAVGKELASIAVNDPAEAKAVSFLVLEQIKCKDKDEVAQSFTESLSDSELSAIAKDTEGKELLLRFREHLLSGSVHSDERATALRIHDSIQGYPTPQLTGNAERDIETVANDLSGLAPDRQAEYLDAVLKHPYGVQTLQRSARLSSDIQQVLADALSNAYNADPSGFGLHLSNLVETEKMYPVYEWTGFATVVAKTGNDALIARYADKAIDFAAANPEYNAVSVDAIQALSGMSPKALANFISFRSVRPPQSGSPTAIGNAATANSAQFHQALTDATSWLSAKANNAGFPNPWAFNPALGDFLNTASRITTSDGRPTDSAMRIFQTVATNTGDNFFTKEAAGAFFIDHAQAVVDRFGALRNLDGTTNRHFKPEVLKDFFTGVVYSPVSDLLEYNGKPLTEVIMGYGAGNTGVIGEIAQSLMNRAAGGGDPEALGREIGYLFGAVSGGFLDAVEAYKDKFDEDKAFREFMYGLVNKGLGAIGKVGGIPLEKVGAFTEKLYEAGRSRERSEKLRGFMNSFLELKNEMGFALLDFENSHRTATGIEESFTNRVDGIDSNLYGQGLDNRIVPGLSGQARESTGQLL